MYINDIDNLFDTILNNFYVYLTENNVFKILLQDTNFVKYQNEILNYIKRFIDNIPQKNILAIIKKSYYIDFIINSIKRYCTFYIYLGIAYYYEDNRDLYITNIIELSKYQKDSKYQITDFFNSDNNAKIIEFYNNIKTILSLLQFKSMDKIKIILSNNALKYKSTINLFNELGEDYIIDFFFIKDNFPKTGTAFADIQLDLMFEAYDKPRATYFVVENEGKIIGGAGISQLESSTENICELQKMYFLEEVRGKGIGFQMIQICLQEGIKLGYEKCYLETLPEMLAAQHLYKKAGFKYLSEPMGSTGHTNCPVWMMKSLNPNT